MSISASRKTGNIVPVYLFDWLAVEEPFNLEGGVRDWDNPGFEVRLLTLSHIDRFRGGRKDRSPDCCLLLHFHPGWAFRLKGRKLFQLCSRFWHNLGLACAKQWIKSNTNISVKSAQWRRFKSNLVFLVNTSVFFSKKDDWVPHIISHRSAPKTISFLLVFYIER